MKCVSDGADLLTITSQQIMVSFQDYEKGLQNISHV